MCTCSRVSGKLCAVAAAAAVAVVVEGKVGLKGSFSTSGSCACVCVYVCVCVCVSVREKERESVCSCMCGWVYMDVWVCVQETDVWVVGMYVRTSCNALHTACMPKKCKYIEMSMCKPGMIAIMVPRCL